ncbi:TAP46-like protein [Abortiporus biennis]
MDTDLPLPALFLRALASASKAYNLLTIEDETQDIIQSAVSDLCLLSSRINALSLFSPNETLGDISTKNLVYLFVPYVAAEVQNRARTLDPDERMENILRIQSYYRSFLLTLETYEIIPESDKELYGKPASSVNDPAKRRELKIQQYKFEKELKTRIETLRKRRQQKSPVSENTPNDFDYIASLLPSPSSSDEEADSETDEILRKTTILLLRLHYIQAHSQLESLVQELELLKNAPPMPPRQQQTSNDSRQGKAREEEDIWKLEGPVQRGGPDGKGPLLDSSGKPIRPFTILPAGQTDRARLQAQVFQPDHRLPTMSIDEYLEMERQRGKFISGGGPQSESKLTTSEQLQLDSEMDGTAFAEERGETKRLKDEAWARYTDTHPKGAGNMMNRG